MNQKSTNQKAKVVGEEITFGRITMGCLGEEIEVSLRANQENNHKLSLVCSSKLLLWKKSSIRKPRWIEVE